MDFVETVLSNVRELLAEPWLARVVAMLCLAVAFYRKGRSLYQAYNGEVFSSLEQEQLFLFLRNLLNSSNGWVREGTEKIMYVWPQQQASVLTPSGALAHRPQVKVHWDGGNIRNLAKFHMGSEDVTLALTKRQINRLSKKSKNICEMLDTEARAGKLNGLLATIR